MKVKNIILYTFQYSLIDTDDVSLRTDENDMTCEHQ